MRKSATVNEPIIYKDHDVKVVIFHSKTLGIWRCEVRDYNNKILRKIPEKDFDSETFAGDSVRSLIEKFENKIRTQTSEFPIRK